MNELKEKAVQRGEESTSEEDISAQLSSGEAIVGGQTTIRPQSKSESLVRVAKRIRSLIGKGVGVKLCGRPA